VYCRLVYMQADSAVAASAPAPATPAQPPAPSPLPLLPPAPPPPTTSPPRPPPPRLTLQHPLPPPPPLPHFQPPPTHPSSPSPHPSAVPTPPLQTWRRPSRYQRRTATGSSCTAPCGYTACASWGQGLTLLHFLAQPKPFWSHLPVSPCLIDLGGVMHQTYHTKCACAEPKSG